MGNSFRRTLTSPWKFLRGKFTFNKKIGYTMTNGRGLQVAGAGFDVAGGKNDFA